MKRHTIYIIWTINKLFMEKTAPEQAYHLLNREIFTREREKLGPNGDVPRAGKL